MSQEKDFTLTTSGYKYDKGLSRVSIKVIPALQAMIANQHDLMDIIRKCAPERNMFIETHMAELGVVEETIAEAHAKYCSNKEEQKKKREEKAKGLIQLPELGEPEIIPQGFDGPVFDDAAMDSLAAKLSPGLPSQRLEQGERTPAREKETDIRRIAVGASIRAVQNLLGRELTGQEISAIEKQVDSYLK